MPARTSVPASSTPVPQPTAKSALLGENWTEYAQNAPWSDATTHGNWFNQYAGYGTVQPIGNALSLAPQASTQTSETHAALVTSTASFDNFNATVIATTVAQLRTPAPNTWEVAWLLWHYTDNTHFYSINLKSNGWELGKEDPAYPGAQRFLATGTTPFPPGVPYAIQVQQSGNIMTVMVNGKQLVTFTDTQSPYLSGKMGLYCEDSHVLFGTISVNAL